MESLYCRKIVLIALAKKHLIQFMDLHAVFFRTKGKHKKTNNEFFLIFYQIICIMLQVRLNKRNRKFLSAFILYGILIDSWIKY